jgi:VanZ family protein
MCNTGMKWLTVAFSLFIAAIIVTADMGVLNGPLRVLHRIPLGDKAGHFFLIGILSFLVTASSIRSLPHRDPGRVALSIGSMLALIFTLEEASQILIRGRNASLEDLLANYAGILVFGLAAWKIHQKRKP